MILKREKIESDYDLIEIIIPKPKYIKISGNFKNYPIKQYILFNKINNKWVWRHNNETIEDDILSLRPQGFKFFNTYFPFTPKVQKVMSIDCVDIYKK